MAAMELMSLLLAAAPVPAVPVFGVNIHFTGSTALPGEVAMLAAAFEIARMDFKWALIEQQRHVYNFSEYDSLLEQLKAHSVTPYWILDYGNNLYQNGSAPTSPEAVSAFTSFVQASLVHFKDDSVIWELWNEPNGKFWKPHANSSQYATLLKNICPLSQGHRLVGPALAGISGDKCAAGGWLDQMLANYTNDSGAVPLEQCLSAISVHPYRFSNPETVSGDYLRLRSLVSRYSPITRIYSGEWGYSTCAQGGQACDQPGPEVDEETQARYLPRQWLTNTMNQVPVSIWYDWRDGSDNRTVREAMFGTVRHEYLGNSTAQPFQPKGSYFAALTFQQQVVKRGAVYQGRMQAPLLASTRNISDAYVLRFALPPRRGNSTSGNGSAETDRQNGRQDQDLSSELLALWSVDGQRKPVASECKHAYTAPQFVRYVYAQGGSCNITHRVDCGFRGISKTKCEDRGCCFTLPMVPGSGPQCYFTNATIDFGAKFSLHTDRPGACFSVVSHLGSPLPDVCADTVSGVAEFNVSDSVVYAASRVNGRSSV